MESCDTPKGGTQAANRSEVPEAFWAVFACPPRGPRFFQFFQNRPGTRADATRVYNNPLAAAAVARGGPGPTLD